MPEKVFVRNISNDLWRKLKSFAALQGKTVSQAVREAIMLWLSHAEKAGSNEGRVNWRRITAVGRSGKSDVSQRHDDYLAAYRLAHRGGK
jgi:plasmid stability protein